MSTPLAAPAPRWAIALWWAECPVCDRAAEGFDRMAIDAWTEHHKRCGSSPTRGWEAPI